MHMNTQFSMPQDGKVLSPTGKYNDMIFEFQGDDDTWVYVDGILVGDGGGVHNQTFIQINFQNGTVTVDANRDIKPVYRVDWQQTLYLQDLYVNAEKYNPDDWVQVKGADGRDHEIRTVFHNDTTWAICLKESGEPIGAMGYAPCEGNNLPSREGEPLVGYWVGRPYWNRGICTEALRLMIDHVRKETEIPSFISGHFFDNPASGRVMEKCGFVPTGETCIDRTLAGSDSPMRVLRCEIKRPR